MAIQTPVLVLNGPLDWTAGLARIARRARPLLAADGGANALARIGLRPQSVIGDLDSIKASVRSWLGEECLIHRPEQNRTDFEKALDFVFVERRLDQLTVLGALEGRVDHTLGNLGLLARQARGPNLIFRSEHQMLLATAAPLELEAKAGETWSFWSFNPKTHVSLEGVRWPVHDLRLSIEDQPSISNQATGTTVGVAPRGGTVVVCRLI